VLLEAGIQFFLQLACLLNGVPELPLAVRFWNKCELEESISEIANELLCEQTLGRIANEVDNVLHFATSWYLVIDGANDGRPPRVTLDFGPY